MGINAEKIDAFISKARDLFNAYIDVFYQEKTRICWAEGKDYYKYTRWRNNCNT